jgi:hypothetical protein
MLCRLFVDEVGNADLKSASHDENARYLSVTGIFTFRHWHDGTIQPAIELLKTDFLGHSQDTPIILHRREILQRTGVFAPLRDDETRRAFDVRVLEMIKQLRYLVITVTIDKAEHLERYRVWRFDPYHYCMQCLVERYVQWLERHDWTGDVVVEARFKKVDKRLKASFSHIWAFGTDYVTASTVQARLTSRELKLFTKRENCAGLQLCDLIAHPSFRAMRSRREGNPVPDDFGGKINDILEAEKLARHPQTQEINGWGRKWLP